MAFTVCSELNTVNLMVVPICHYNMKFTKNTQESCEKNCTSKYKFVSRFFCKTMIIKDIGNTGGWLSSPFSMFEIQFKGVQVEWNIMTTLYNKFFAFIYYTKCTMSWHVATTLSIWMVTYLSSHIFIQNLEVLLNFFLKLNSVLTV